MALTRLCTWFACHALLSLAALTLAAGPASACGGRIAASSEARLTYQPFEPVALARQHRITVQNTGAEACVFWLSFNRLDMPGQSLGGLAFQINGAQGEALTVSAPRPAAVEKLASRALAPEESYDFIYAVSLPPGQITAPGDYEQSIEIKLQGSPGAQPGAEAAVLDTRLLRLSCLVQRYLSLNIAGAGTMKTIDFGALKQGDSKRIIIEARSNQIFILEASSRNGGVMAMEPPFQTWRVGYAMALNGSQRGMPARMGPFGGTSIGGHQFDFVFTIGDVANKRAGLYTDEIMIEIKPAI